MPTCSKPAAWISASDVAASDCSGVMNSRITATAQAAAISGYCTSSKREKHKGIAVARAPQLMNSSRVTLSAYKFNVTWRIGEPDTLVVAAGQVACCLSEKREMSACRISATQMNTVKQIQVLGLYVI